MVGGAINVTATVTKPHRNYFSGIVGFNSWPVTTTATAIGGMPNAAIGAMPIIFNKKAFPHAVGPANEMSFDEPGTGNEDVPADRDPVQLDRVLHRQRRAATRLQRQLEHGRRPDPQPRQLDDRVTLDDDIGPLNAGAHATLFSALADLVGTDDNEFPVAIVDDDGNMVGWAMFHLTGSVGGSTKQIRGYFVSPVNRGSAQDRRRA